MSSILNHSIEFLVKICFLVPLPWRAFIIVTLASILLYKISYFSYVMILYPEFVVTNRLRGWGQKPVPGTYIFNQIIEKSLGLIKLITFLCVIISVMFLVCWYIRPNLNNDMVIATYIDKSIQLWNSLENFVISKV